MTATVTNLPNPQPNPGTNPPNPSGGEQAAEHVAVGDSPDRMSEKDIRRARDWLRADLRQASRLLYTASATARRGTGDVQLADQIDRVREDLVAVIAGEDTPSEIRYGDLAADASAYADEVEKLREELEEARGPRVHGKGN